MLKDNRGAHMKCLSEENFKKVSLYVSKNPDSTREEACRNLGITRKTLKKYLDMMQEKPTANASER